MYSDNRYWSKFGTNDNPILEGDKSQSILVIGNSHAIDLTYALKENGLKSHVDFIGTTHLCFNFGSPVKNELKYKETCQAARSRIFHTDFSQYKRIYLHDNWAKLNLSDLEEFLSKLRAASNIPIYVFGPKMIYGKTIPDIVSNAPTLSLANRYSYQFTNPSRISYNEELKKHFKSEGFVDNVFYVDVLTTQCGSSYEECKIISDQDNSFYYFDGGHFTLKGSRNFGKKLKKKYPELFVLGDFDG